MRRFYIDPSELQKSDPRITGKDARHIRKVLRLQAGSALQLFDGSGRIMDACIKGFDGDAVLISVSGSRDAQNESPTEIIVAQGFLKEKKMEELIRPLTELGITRLIPMITERTIARPDQKRMDKRIERWRSITIESMKQCGRAVAPEISTPTAFSDVLALTTQVDRSVFFWEQDTTPLIADPAASFGSVLLLLGPEGGFSASEAEQAKAAGCRFASLGPRILRAQTAAVTACVLAQYLYGDIKKSP